MVGDRVRETNEGLHRIEGKKEEEKEEQECKRSKPKEVVWAVELWKLLMAWQCAQCPRRNWLERNISLMAAFESPSPAFQRRSEYGGESAQNAFFDSNKFELNSNPASAMRHAQSRPRYNRPIDEPQGIMSSV